MKTARSGFPCIFCDAATRVEDSWDRRSGTHEGAATRVRRRRCTDCDRVVWTEENVYKVKEDPVKNSTPTPDWFKGIASDIEHFEANLAAIVDHMVGAPGEVDGEKFRALFGKFFSGCEKELIKLRRSIDRGEHLRQPSDGARQAARN